MKLLSNNGTVSPLQTVGPGGPGPNEAAAARQAARPRPRLPRDATVQFNNHPPEIWINMTISRMEHVEALMETLRTFGPQLQAARERDYED